MLHDVFVAALTSIDQVRDPNALRGWLTGIAVRKARKCIVKRRRWRIIQFFAPMDMPEGEARVTPSDVSEALRCTYEVLGRFPADERLAFALRHIDGMELTAVAAACGVSLATIKRRLVARTSDVHADGVGACRARGVGRARGGRDMSTGFDRLGEQLAREQDALLEQHNAQAEVRERLARLDFSEMRTSGFGARPLAWASAGGLSLAVAIAALVMLRGPQPQSLAVKLGSTGERLPHRWFRRSADCRRGRAAASPTAARWKWPNAAAPGWSGSKTPVLTCRSRAGSST